MTQGPYDPTRVLSDGSPTDRGFPDWKAYVDRTLRRLDSRIARTGIQPTLPPSYVASGTGPFGTAVPTATTGHSFVIRAGILRGTCYTTAFATAQTGMQVLWWLDGIPICYSELLPGHVISAHTQLSPGQFSITVAAGTHYLYGQLTLGGLDANDRWSFKGDVTDL